MYAIIETGGKQYRVEKGMQFEHERTNGVSAGEPIEFDRVLLLVDENGVRVGTPYVDSVTVKGEVCEEARGEKIIVYSSSTNTRARKDIGASRVIVSRT